MSIATYADLQTAVSNWLHRSDLSSYVPDFITLAESRIGREVRSKYQEERLATTAANYLTLPSDYLEMRALWVTASPSYSLEYMDPFVFFQKYDTSESGDPTIYTIIGDTLRFWPSPNSNAIELWYYKKLTALSSSVNSLFTNHPDLYLYASLAAATPFLKDDKRVALWEGEYKSVRDSVNRNERQGRYGNSLRVVNS